MNQQTNNSFFYCYLCAKGAWNINNDHYKEVLSSPLPPTKITYKVKNRMMSKEEWNRAMKILKTLNVK